MSDSGVPRGNEGEEEDCPVCLEPLPPFWDIERRSTLVCCGGAICGDCSDKRIEFLQRAHSEGTWGRQEEQLSSTCPLCRTPRPTSNDVGRMMLARFEKGQLPLNMYHSLGMNFVDGGLGVEMNAERGTEIWRLGAEKGDPNCQYELGVVYRKGEEVSKSTEEAKKWYLAAAEQGHAIAEYNLAIMVKEEGNDPESLRCMRGSASKGFDNACYNLGVAHYNGEDSAQQSREEAIRVLTPAAERGDVDSMGLLGCILCQPDPKLRQPLPQDNPNFTKGVHWLYRAAEKGEETAVSNLKVLEETNSSMCFRCNSEAPPGNTFLRCSRCRAAWYCSKDCQVQHWRAAEAGHKQFCIKWE